MITPFLFFRIPDNTLVSTPSGAFDISYSDACKLISFDLLQPCNECSCQAQKGLNDLRLNQTVVVFHLQQDDRFSSYLDAEKVCAQVLAMATN